MGKSPWENEIFASESLESIDRRFLPGTKQEIEFIIQELNLPPGSSILDIGCGAGRHSIELAKAGYSVTGVDISSRMLKEAGERAQESQVTITFVELDVLSWKTTLWKIVPVSMELSVSVNLDLDLLDGRRICQYSG